MGRVAGFGVEPEFDANRADLDVIKLRFIVEDHLHQNQFAEFLREHAAAVRKAAGEAAKLVSV